ncbi:YbfB/YjiJ family MFS transporter, partial [Salmonella enterica]|uniref:YbfB/YjiJ family MFS transporter n=1 Tax=Salmonella enterica TaxID=28901 RepID=UPI00398C6037
MLVRFLARVASAGMMIFGSMIVFLHARHPFVIAVLYSGVCAGIALCDAYVIGGLHSALSARSLWLGAGPLAGILLIIAAILIPPRAHSMPPAPFATIENQPMTGWQPPRLYGFAVFGYISVATSLPLMATSAGSSAPTAPLWCLA